MHAVQDQLMMQSSSLEELRAFKAEHESVANLQTKKSQLMAEVAELEKQVASKRSEAAEASEHVVELKSELKHGVSRLEEYESRYSRLEAQIRDMTLSKYKGLLGTGALAVLSSNQQNKENSQIVPNRNSSGNIVIPKRQLRTVSLADR